MRVDHSTTTAQPALRSMANQSFGPPAAGLDRPAAGQDSTEQQVDRNEQPGL